MATNNIQIKTTLFIFLAFVVALGLYFCPPIPQNPQYNHFADIRTFFGIPNALNVITNIPFLIVGILGLHYVFQHKDEYSIFYAVFFFGILWVCAGSSYYHWYPDDSRLVWDRLPMTIAFTSFFTAVIAERISLQAARYLLVPFLVLGIFSVVYWHFSHMEGHGDLRLYLYVQFFPMLAFPYLLLAFPAKYTAAHNLWLSLIVYLIAHVCELLDKPIYHILHGTISGHSIKHLLAVLSSYYIYRYLRDRNKVTVDGR